MGFPSGPLGFVTRYVFPFIHVSFKKDCVDALGKVGLGSPGCVSLFGKIKVRKLGPYLAVVKFFERFRGCSGNLGWEVIVPGKNVV